MHMIRSFTTAKPSLTIGIAGLISFREFKMTSMKFMILTQILTMSWILIEQGLISFTVQLPPLTTSLPTRLTVYS